LQGIAEPNTVVVDDGTRKLVGTLFEISDLGSKDLMHGAVTRSICKSRS
jgi:hypothetical protein